MWLLLLSIVKLSRLTRLTMHVLLFHFARWEAASAQNTQTERKRRQESYISPYTAPTHTNTNLCLTWLFAHCVHTRLTCCFDIIISTFPRCSVSVTTEVTAAIHSVSLCDVMCCVLALDCHTYYSLTLQCPIAEWMACYCVLSSFCFDIVVVSTLNTSSYTHTHTHSHPYMKYSESIYLASIFFKLIDLPYAPTGGKRIAVVLIVIRS